MDLAKLQKRILIVLYMALDSVFLAYYGNIFQMDYYSNLYRHSYDSYSYSTRNSDRDEREDRNEASLKQGTFLRVSTAGSSIIIFSFFLIAIFQFQIQKPIKALIFVLLTVGLALIIAGMVYGNLFYEVFQIEQFNFAIGFGVGQIFLYLIAVMELLKDDEIVTKSLNAPLIQ